MSSVLVNPEELIRHFTGRFTTTAGSPLPGTLSVTFIGTVVNCGVFALFKTTPLSAQVNIGCAKPHA